LEATSRPSLGHVDSTPLFQVPQLSDPVGDGEVEMLGPQKRCWQILAQGLHGHVGAHAQVAPLKENCDVSWWSFPSGATRARAPIKLPMQPVRRSLPTPFLPTPFPLSRRCLGLATFTALVSASLAWFLLFTELRPRVCAAALRTRLAGDLPVSSMLQWLLCSPNVILAYVVSHRISVARHARAEAQKPTSA